MKTTDTFKSTIQNHLNEIAEKDPLFAKTLEKENKNIEDCCTYILNQVKDSGCVGFTDPEIFGMAIHYYDEDDIKVGDKINMNVVVNHHVELTEEEKELAKQKAMDALVEDEKKKLADETKVKLTKEDIAEAEQLARQKAIDEAIANKKEKLTKRAEKKKPKPATGNPVQSSLFD